MACFERRRGEVSARDEGSADKSSLEHNRANHAGTHNSIRKLWPSLWPLAHSLSRCDHLGICVNGPRAKRNQNETVSCEHGVELTGVATYVPRRICGNFGVAKYATTRHRRSSTVGSPQAHQEFDASNILNCVETTAHEPKSCKKNADRQKQNEALMG